MTFTFRFKTQFALEWENLPSDLQDRVDDFLDLYEAHGLGSFKRYPGKITQSWKGLLPGDPTYAFTFDNDLWHYHVGHPRFTPAWHGNYATSDWVLHFQWPDWQHNGSHIELVDLYGHWDSNGNFWLPRPKYLHG